MKFHFTNKNTQRISVLLTASLLFWACSVSYNFNSGSIDYSKYKSISIGDFPNTAEIVVPTLSQTFSETLKDKFTNQTRLEILSQGGDMRIAGEIVGYHLESMAISADSYASQTKLTLTINVRFTNNVVPEDDFEKRFSAFQMFDSNLMLNDVQDELIKTMVDEIIDNIYNETVAKW